MSAHAGKRLVLQSLHFVNCELIFVFVICTRPLILWCAVLAQEMLPISFARALDVSWSHSLLIEGRPGVPLEGLSGPCVLEDTCLREEVGQSMGELSRTMAPVHRLEALAHVGKMPQSRCVWLEFQSDSTQALNYLLFKVNNCCLLFKVEFLPEFFLKEFQSLCKT